MNLFGLTAYAQEGAAAAENVSGGAMVGSMAVQMLPLLIIVVLFYFLLIRPQRKRDKENKAMLAAMKVGDKVVTIGGICGKVIKIKDNFVYIETGVPGKEIADCALKFERDAIKSVEKKQSN